MFGPSSTPRRPPRLEDEYCRFCSENGRNKNELCSIHLVEHCPIPGYEEYVRDSLDGSWIKYDKRGLLAADELLAREAYVISHTLPAKSVNEFDSYFAARDAFVNGNDSAKDAMLSFVTEYDPPYETSWPKKIKRPKISFDDKRIIFSSARVELFTGITVLGLICAVLAGIVKIFGG